MTYSPESSSPKAEPASRPTIAVLVSGTGTTLRNLIECEQRGALVPAIAVVISSNPQAGGARIAEQAGIPLSVIDWKKTRDVEAFSAAIFDRCRAAKVDYVVLGGFLKRLKIPADFINRVVNIHPSLIPSFCGKGFYGIRVHQAVLAYGCRVTGCTVHFVDDHYDHGPIIAQVPVIIHPLDSAETLAARVFAEECRIYPEVINQLALGRISVAGRQVSIAES